MKKKDTEKPYVKAKQTNTLIAPTDCLTQKTMSGKAQKETCELSGLNTKDDCFHFPTYFTGKSGKKVTEVVMGVWDAVENGEEIPSSQITLGKELNIYDQAVFNAVISILVAGNEYFTIPMVLRVMYGITPDKSDYYKTFSEEQIKLTKASIRKLQGTMVAINCQSESEAFQKKNPNLLRTRGYVIPLMEFAFVLNGVETEGFRFQGNINDLTSFPILYQFAKAKGQISSMPVALLDTPCYKSETTIKIQEYLRQRLAMLQSEKAKKVSNKILLDTLFEAIGFDQSSKNARKEKERIIKQIEKLLNYWKEQNMISGYEWEYDTAYKTRKRSIIIE